VVPETGSSCQLIALKAGIANFLVGRELNEVPWDSRRFDRMLKFPSGELPVQVGTQATVGGSPLESAKPSGFLDEVNVILRRYPPKDVPTTYILDQVITERSQEFKLRDNMLRDARGVRGLTYLDGGSVHRDLSPVGPTFKRGGGLLMIDGEIMCYEEVRGDGTVVLARNGRGLLGTRPAAGGYRSHDLGASVVFLDQVPATVLQSEMSASSAAGHVKSMSTFPFAEGTLLLDQELMHYTWVRAGSEDGAGFEMPERQTKESANSQQSGDGLFRGRFGTGPARHPAGTPVLYFPFRYWDRWQERSEDPGRRSIGSCERRKSCGGQALAVPVPSIGAATGLGVTQLVTSRVGSARELAGPPCQRDARPGARAQAQAARRADAYERGDARALPPLDCSRRGRSRRSQRRGAARLDPRST
jgi:hypothetical protein